MVGEVGVGGEVGVDGGRFRGRIRPRGTPEWLVTARSGCKRGKEMKKKRKIRRANVTRSENKYRGGT